MVVVVGAGGGQIWDIRSKTLIQHYPAHKGAVSSIAFHPSGHFLLSSSLDSTLKARRGGMQPHHELPASSP